MPKLKEGQKAPDFLLPSDDGREFRLSEYAGRNVVLYFYPKNHTPGCTQEACEFQSSMKQFEQLNAVVVGVSPDSMESHRLFKKNFRLNFKLLSDRKQKILRQYGVWRRKSLYGKFFMGVERTTILIDREGVIRRIFPKVRVEGHIAQVSEALKSFSGPPRKPEVVIDGGLRMRMLRNRRCDLKIPESPWPEDHRLSLKRLN